MVLSVRAMTVSEVSLIIDYFYTSTPEHLEMLGVDPTRMPSRSGLAIGTERLVAASSNCR